MNRWLHVDINAYFATLLQQENPGLRGKPIGVLKSAGRSCVITASKEAKARGVKTGCSKEEALELVPEIIFVPANFPMCLDATKRLHRIFTNTVPTVEIFSLDESFLDLTDCETLYPDAMAVGRMVQQRIKSELGSWVTCNVGVAKNRFLAKLASEVSPKGSVTQVTDQNQDDFLSNAEFADVCGIGRRLEQRLRSIGVSNTYMINFVPDEDLIQQCGEYWAKELRKMARGEEPALLARGNQPPKAVQSIGRSITGYRLSDDEDNIRRVFYNLTAEVMYKARRQRLTGRQVIVYASNKHGLSWGAHRTLRSPLRHTAEMFEVLYHQLYKPWKRTFPIIKYGVQLSLLQPWESTLEPIWEEWQRGEQVAQAVDAITAKFGLYSVRSGVMSDRESLIRPEVTGYLGDKTYQMTLT
jgi:DNA polymerase-4